MSIAREDVIQYIENMTVLELSEFVKVLEDKFGVSAAMPMMAAGAAPAAGAGKPESHGRRQRIQWAGIRRLRRRG